MLCVFCCDALLVIAMLTVLPDSLPERKLRMSFVLKTSRLLVWKPVTLLIEGISCCVTRGHNQMLVRICKSAVIMFAKFRLRSAVRHLLTSEARSRWRHFLACVLPSRGGVHMHLFVVAYMVDQHACGNTDMINFQE